MKDPHHIWKTAIGVTRWIGSPASVVIHTLLFVGTFVAAAEDLIDFQEMLLVLTTIVSLEAIYLSIFIHMTINYTTQELAEVGEDIEAFGFNTAISALMIYANEIQAHVIARRLLEKGDG